MKNYVRRPYHFEMVREILIFVKFSGSPVLICKYSMTYEPEKVLSYHLLTCLLTWISNDILFFITLLMSYSAYDYKKTEF